MNQENYKLLHTATHIHIHIHKNMQQQSDSKWCEDVDRRLMIAILLYIVVRRQRRFCRTNVHLLKLITSVTSLSLADDYFYNDFIILTLYKREKCCRYTAGAGVGLVVCRLSGSKTSPFVDNCSNYIKRIWEILMYTTPIFSTCTTNF